MQSLYNAYATATPSQKMAAAARHMRLAKINKAAAKAKLAELCPIEPEPVEVIEVIEPVDPSKEWVERQKAIPIKKAPWFFVEDDLGPVAPRPPLVDEIITATARHFEFGINEILASRRFAPLVRARQIAMYLAKKLTIRTLPEIGRSFGGMDHTTVLHAVRKIERLVAIDHALAAEIDAIKAEIRK